VKCDVKVNATSSGEESFCSSSDDQRPASTNNSTCSFLAPLPPLHPSCHSRCPPSVVDAGAQSFSPLSTFAGYPFPVLPPASTPGLVPPASPAGYRLALQGTPSRGRLQRQNAVKSSSAKLASPSRTRSHTGQCLLSTRGRILKFVKDYATYSPI